METALSRLTYYCNRSILLYASAISMAEKANLRDIFRSLKRRRLKLLQFIKREITEKKADTMTIHIDNLSDLLSEIKSNEKHLIEYSNKIVKNNRVKSSNVKEFIQNSTSEIISSLHWLDVISAHYNNRSCDLKNVVM